MAELATTTPAPTGPARLLTALRRPGLAGHIEAFGRRPRGSRLLVDEVRHAGLRGRGGAGFPTATKLASVARGRRAIVVANGTEGEPASAKDKTLLRASPHLVLDGAALAAEAVGAREVILCVDRAATEVIATLQHALGERQASGDPVAIRLEGAPSRFVAGEESALIHWLNGGEAKPTLVPPRPYERGVDGRPTLVQNVETLADLALIARFGAGWYRSAGLETEPGTALFTVAGAVDRPGVYEAPFGLPLVRLLSEAGWPGGPTPAVLVGGYYGTWIAPALAAELSMASDSLARAGASLGCGLVWALPAGGCGLVESARVARWFAAESAGQCGPCLNGLPAIAGAMDDLAAGRRPAQAWTSLERWLAMVEGRGACAHPNGAVQFVSSALRVFRAEVERHGQHGPCPASARPGLLPTPTGGAWR